MESRILPTWTQKIQTWYNNNKNVTLEGESTLVPVGTTWNFRLVVQHLFKDDIAQKMEDSGLKASDKGWLQGFQWAVNEVIESLGGEQVVSEKYGEMAKAWNEADLPEDLRRR